MVSINYRLGPLGFLYLPQEQIYGNAGLKDQVTNLVVIVLVFNPINKYLITFCTVASLQMG